MPPISFELVTLNWEKKENTSLPVDSGVYQIYGTSPLYGIDTLLYIGQATNLLARVSYHFDKENNNVIGKQPNLSVRYALVPAQLLDVVEQVLIVMYKPSFNSSSLKNIKAAAKARPYYIQNHGDRGLLNYENTNYYFIQNPEAWIVKEPDQS